MIDKVFRDNNNYGIYQLKIVWGTRDVITEVSDELKNLLSHGETYLLSKELIYSVDSVLEDALFTFVAMHPDEVVYYTQTIRASYDAKTLFYVNDEPVEGIPLVTNMGNYFEVPSDGTGITKVLQVVNDASMYCLIDPADTVTGVNVKVLPFNVIFEPYQLNRETIIKGLDSDNAPLELSLGTDIKSMHSSDTVAITAVDGSFTLTLKEGANLYATHQPIYAINGVNVVSDILTIQL